MAEEKRLTLKFAYMKGNLSTPFAKVFKAWREKEGVSENSFRFLFEGTTIDKDDTCVARPPAFAASSARLIVNLFSHSRAQAEDARDGGWRAGRRNARAAGRRALSGHTRARARKQA